MAGVDIYHTISYSSMPPMPLAAAAAHVRGLTCHTEDRDRRINAAREPPLLCHSQFSFPRPSDVTVIAVVAAEIFFAAFSYGRFLLKGKKISYGSLLTEKCPLPEYYIL